MAVICLVFQAYKIDNFQVVKQWVKGKDEWEQINIDSGWALLNLFFKIYIFFLCKEN